MLVESDQAWPPQCLARNSLTLFCKLAGLKPANDMPRLDKIRIRQKAGQILTSTGEKASKVSMASEEEDRWGSLYSCHQVGISSVQSHGTRSTDQHDSKSCFGMSATAVCRFTELGQEISNLVKSFVKAEMATAALAAAADTCSTKEGSQADDNLSQLPLQVEQLEEVGCLQ